MDAIDTNTDTKTKSVVMECIAMYAMGKYRSKGLINI